MIDAPLNSFSYDLNISTPEMPGFLSSNPTHMHRRRAACAQADGVVCAQDASGVDDVVASGVVGGDLVVDLGLAEDGFLDDESDSDAELAAGRGARAGPGGV